MSEWFKPEDKTPPDRESFLIWHINGGFWEEAYMSKYTEVISYKTKTGIRSAITGEIIDTPVLWMPGPSAPNK